MSYGYVYKLTYKKNNKIYIGAKTGTKVNLAYYGSGSIWTKEVLNKCNPSTDIDREILQWCNTAEELSDAEKYWIAKYNSTNSDIGYNILKGGQVPTIKQRQNMSNIIHNGMTNIRKQKISNGLKKQRQEVGMSAEHKQHLSDSLKGRNIGCNGDSRSIQVYCIVNNKKYTFHNKIQAAKWWYDNYPFSDIYATITYTRMITKSINNLPLTYKSKPINQNIQWFEDTTQLTENDPVYCIFNNTRYDFKTVESAAEWWFENYPLGKDDYNRLRYITKIHKSIKGFEITYKGFIYNKIKWFRKE